MTTIPPTRWELTETHGYADRFARLIAEGHDIEVRLLRHLTQFLHPQGRFLVGFHPTDGPCGGRDYSWEEFSSDVAAAGLAVQHRFGSYQLEPAHDRYVVAVLTRA